MNAAKRKKLEEAGWAVGSTSDFLNLTESENTIIAMKIALAKNLKAMRQSLRLTQAQLAHRIGSSQSRIAKMEMADKSVSVDLFVKSLACMGATRKDIGKAISSNSATTKVAAKNSGAKKRQVACA